MFLKHKNMKDVCAWVVDLPQGYCRAEPFKAKVWWINITNMKKPFICSPCTEDIIIKEPKEWKDITTEIKSEGL